MLTESSLLCRDTLGPHHDFSKNLGTLINGYVLNWKYLPSQYEYTIAVNVQFL